MIFSVPFVLKGDSRSQSPVSDGSDDPSNRVCSATPAPVKGRERWSSHWRKDVEQAARGQRAAGVCRLGRNNEGLPASRDGGLSPYPRRCHRRLMAVSSSAEHSSGHGFRKQRLMDRVREAIRVRHYSRRTEEAYTHWIRRFIVFHGKRHPDELGNREISIFLASLATDGRAAASTQKARRQRPLPG